MNSKITEQHQNKPAYIYVRQAAVAQVRHQQESTERQYALRQKALELGWTEDVICTLDGDLGVSGTQTTGRTDFKTLVADVSMGQVGAVFALEASRLARSNVDWHRLLELCALTRTLVIDEDGSYDPADFNDGLLLGLQSPARYRLAAKARAVQTGLRKCPGLARVLGSHRQRSHRGRAGGCAGVGQREMPRAVAVRSSLRSGGRSH